MSKTNVKELIICIVAFVLLLLAITTNVFADNAIDLMNDLSNNKANNTNINTNTNKNTSTNKNTNKNKNTNTNKNVNAMPDTGLDSSGLVIVAICGVSTLYAYKKIRDYKNI